MATALRSIALGMVCAFAASTLAIAAAPGALEIYFIDVEGGQSTLVVTPEKHTLLIDAGFASDGKGFDPGDPHKARDANRILAAARDAGVSQIDYLLITHFHTDHFGGVSELAQLIPIRGFVDHGAPHPRASATSTETKDAFTLYSALRSKGGRHIDPRPGERLPFSDIEVTVLSSGGATLSAAMPGGGEATPGCPKQPLQANDPDENPRSTGVVVRHGKFRFLDVGDLSGQPLLDLVCPKNLAGPVDAYLTAHHGGADAAEPATLAAFRPRVVMMNNAVRKGGQRAMFDVLHRAPGIEGVWQLHYSADAGEINFPAEYIANLDDSAAHWIKLVANADGSFRVFNARTKQWKDYPVTPSRSASRRSIGRN